MRAYWNNHIENNEELSIDFLNMLDQICERLQHELGVYFKDISDTATTSTKKRKRSNICNFQATISLLCLNF